MSNKAMTPGSIARVYRDGHDLVGIFNVPESGAFVLRSLPVGAYVAHDEASGNLIDFTVRVDEERTTVWEPRSGRSDIEGGAEPGAASVKPIGGEKDDRMWHPLNTPGFPNVGSSGVTGSDEPGVTEPEKIPPPPRRDAPDGDVTADDFRVPGAAGSALVEEIPSGVGIDENLPAREQAKLAAGKAGRKAA